MTNPLVSIIIPCFNQAQYIPDALNSVLAQTYTNWECIIVNDGSPDNTEEVASEWLKKDNRFRYLKKENGGLSDARNFGINYSEGEYILPLDADDKISKTYVEEAIKIFKSNSNVNVVYSEAEYFGDVTGKWELPKFSREELLLRNIVFCSAFFRREDYNKTSGYDVNLKNGWEDWDLWLSFLELGFDFFQIPNTRFFYRVKQNSMIKSLNDDQKKMLHKHIFLKHIDLYLENLGSPQDAYLKVNDLMSSKDYRIGKFILYPLRKIKGLFV